MKKVPTAPKAALTKEQSSFSLTLKFYNNKKYDDLIRTFVYNIFENIQMTAKTEQHLCHEFQHLFGIQSYCAQEILVVWIIMGVSHSLSPSPSWIAGSLGLYEYMVPTIFCSNVDFYLGDAPSSIAILKTGLADIATFCETDMEHYGAGHP